MASQGAILRAAMASKAAGGPGRPTPGPQGQFIGQLPSYSMNPGGSYSYTYGPFLPRPADTFTSGAFGPFSPILPVPVDTPPPGTERAQPRRWQYPVGYNLPIGTPGSDGFKLASFDQLKTLSRLYSILRQCIEIRKNEIRGLDWDIVLTPDAAKAYKGDREAMRDFGERRAKAIKWFRRPDPNYLTFSAWLNTMMDQVFTIDALTLYMCPTKGGRAMGKGLLGSGLDSLWLLDGASIRPLVGLHGEVPRPPAVAFEQYIYSVPRSDFTAIAEGRDLAEIGMDDADLRGRYRGDQIIYLPFLQQADNPYGFGITERALIPIMTGLQKQAFQLNYFTEGTVPAVYISPGDASMTPNQIRELQDALNAVAGDPAWHHKIIVLPPGSKTMPQKDAAIVDQADEWIATEVCMAADINPMEVGILPRVSTVASPFAAREMAQASRTIHQRISTKPTLKTVQDIFDVILQVVAGQDDMRFMFSGMEETQDQAALTDMGIKQIQSGVISIDEFRDLIGRVPWDLPETSEPVVFTQMGPIPLGQAQALLGLPQGSNGGSGPSSTLTLPNGTGAPTGAHAAAQGHMRATQAGGMNASGRPGSVTERQRSRGGRLAPTHAQGTGAPGRATGKPAPKAAMAELAALGRHLRKGRDLSTWQPVHLEPHILSAVRGNMAMGLSPDEAVTVVAEVFKATGGQAVPPFGQPPSQPPPLTIQQIIATYGPQIAAAFAAAVAAAALLIAAWIAGTLAVTAAVLAAMILADLRKYLGPVLAALWQAAWGAAVAEAEAQAGPVPDEEQLRRDLEAFLATEGETWLDRISGTREAALIQAIKDALAAGDPEAVVAELERILGVSFRSDLISVTEAMRAWNAGLWQAMKAAGVTFKTWQTMRDGKVCPVCRANQDQGPVPLDAPFQSGLPAPPQHPNCRCWVLPWLPTPTAAKALTRHVSDNGEVFWAEQDAPELNAAGGGALLHPYPHNIDGGPVPGGTVGPTAGGEPPRWDGSQPFPQARWIEGGDDADQGRERGVGSRPSGTWPATYMDGWYPDGAPQGVGNDTNGAARGSPQRGSGNHPDRPGSRSPQGDGGRQMDGYWPQGGIGSAQPPASSIPGDENDRGRPPNAVGKSVSAATLMADAPKAKAGAVYRQLLANYPADSIAWVRQAERWVGPVEVPLDAIDWDHEASWAAHHQTAKVEHFMRQLAAHEPVNPAIGIVQPGDSRIRIIDGHHRSLACRHLGWPSRMYVGLVTDDAAAQAALESHLYQQHQGNDPEND